VVTERPRDVAPITPAGSPIDGLGFVDHRSVLHQVILDRLSIGWVTMSASPQTLRQALRDRVVVADGPHSMTSRGTRAATRSST
jgi:hypothetical protein